MVRNGKVVEGNFIAFAEGYDIASSDPNVRKALNEAVLDDLGFLRDTNRIEVFDYLCGQTDRHDGSFPNVNKDADVDKNMIDPDKVRSYNWFILCIPAVDKELANKISKLDRKQLEFYLRDVLDKEYIDRTAERLDRMNQRMYGYSPEKKKAEAEKEAERRQKLMDTKLADYRKAAGLIPAARPIPERLQLKVPDLEKQVFKDIQSRKQKFHQQKQEIKQSTSKESTQKNSEETVHGKAMGK